MKIFSVLTLVLLALNLPLQAKVELPEQICSHMVIQQQTKAKLWGWARNGAKIDVTVSWNKEIYTTKVDKTGRWEVFIDTPAASFVPQQLTISDGEPIVLDDVLVGEVWLASGQSNMEMPLRGFWNCPVEESAQTIALSGQYRDRIRYLSIEKQECFTPQDKVKGSWKICTPENAISFGATAFYFAENLTRILDVPIGIINNSWGGSKVEGWLPKEVLKEYGEPYTEEDILKIDQGYHRPEIMYNGVHNPIVGYTIRGCIWYQGESNVGLDKTFVERMSKLIQLWRKEWNQGDFPFYMVEIAPYEYGWDPQAARLREAQHKVCEIVPNTDIISTSDLVYSDEINQIHPRQKAKVGQRLSYLALSGTYGLKGFPSHGPSFKSMEVKDGKVILQFNNIDDGFDTLNTVEGFEVCGDDHKFVKAQAKSTGREIELISEEVKTPIAVRYCFHNFEISTIGGASGLPLVPFRTDQFE